jgi:hypothetical protein
VYDSGWWAATEALAEEYYLLEIGNNPPLIQVGAPDDSIVRLPRAFTGLFIFVDAWQTIGFQSSAFNAEFCDYGGAVTFEHMPDAGGALLGSDGNIYWPPWATAQATRTINYDLIPVPDIVTGICDRVDVDSSKLNLTRIAGLTARGYPIARQMSAADAIRGLQLPYMFDMPEWDRQIHAVPRGAAPVATITDDDLVDTDDEEVIRKQSMEFPRKLPITAPDPTANHDPMTQTATRRSLLVKSESEVNIPLALTLEPDETAQIAVMELKIDKGKLTDLIDRHVLQPAAAEKLASAPSIASTGMISMCDPRLGTATDRSAKRSSTVAPEPGGSCAIADPTHRTKASITAWRRCM